MDHSIWYQDAAQKRDADLALVAQKSQDKADLETDLNDDKTDKQAAGAAPEMVSLFSVKMGIWVVDSRILPWTGMFFLN